MAYARAGGPYRRERRAAREMRSENGGTQGAVIRHDDLYQPTVSGLSSRRTHHEGLSPDEDVQRPESQPGTVREEIGEK